VRIIVWRSEPELLSKVENPGFPRGCAWLAWRLGTQLLDGEAMSEVCRAFGISRKTGYKIFERYKEHGLEALTDRSRRHHLISLLDHGRRHVRGDTSAR
jgi:hypothetical protein